MNNALISGGVSVASASVAALIQWIFSSFGHPVPAEVLPLLTAGAVTAGHLVQFYLVKKFGVAPSATTEAKPATAQ